MRISLFWLPLPLLFGLVPASANEAFSWLERMADAVHGLNYQGVFVYLHGNELETIRLTHSVSEGREVERLISLNGMQREVVRDEHSVVCVYPERRLVSVGSRDPAMGYRALLTADPEALRPYYRVRLSDEVFRIAGRDARQVSVTPADEFRYGYRLYLDSENALPLKRELLGVDQTPVAQVMFTGLEVAAEIPVAWELVSEGEGESFTWSYKAPMRPLDGDELETGWRFENRPPGFELRFHAVRPPSKSSPQVEQFVFSDGLAAVSVYLEAQSESVEPLEGGRQMGAVNLFGRLLDGYQVTAMGEAPKETVLRLAQGVARTPKDSPTEAR